MKKAKPGLHKPRALAELVGIGDANLHLLETALTHPSFFYENPSAPQEHNQRLEFLGDAVLGLIVGEQLYQRYSTWPEGELSRRRAAIVCEANLAAGARRLNLGVWLRLGRGEESSGGRDKPSILADALEAVIGAIYLASGLDAARKFVLGLFGTNIENVQSVFTGDNKTAFQEWVQRKGPVDIRYRILEESGPDHDKRFIAAVYVNGAQISSGQGRTKKEAEQQAAGRALRLLTEEKGMTP
ncbi:ribonuclease III [Heliobacillus mobilis]|uniref:Ribonuclease 3 n=1 Tax=Heliobacterium mobile TaxID=28064 RepID=A0A6I3SGC5_HELMO|nr:ribonuclease III [Heliobacterium mobile]MTV47671.1 ribonuclease III [Heliobacterium mobile]